LKLPEAVGLIYTLTPFCCITPQAMALHVTTAGAGLMLALLLQIGGMTAAVGADASLNVDAASLALHPGDEASGATTQVPADPHLEMAGPTASSAAGGAPIRQPSTTSDPPVDPLLQQLRLIAAGGAEGNEITAGTRMSVVPPPLTTRASNNLRITSDWRSWAGLGAGISSQF
jgi:hypothetical protein